jgi:hypothetical protein
MSRPLRWLVALLALALLLLFAALLAPAPQAQKPGWCVWFCGHDICPPCPGDPPEGTLAPVLVREPAGG